MDILYAAIAAADAARLLDRALNDVAVVPRRGRVALIAAGKAAGPMAGRFAQWAGDRLSEGVVSAPALPSAAPGTLVWYRTGHPTPTAPSVQAGERALAVAHSVHSDDTLVVLVSGGASAMLAVPAPELTLDDKIAATRALLEGGADIYELNCVRKHLSRIKGGWLAAATAASVYTLALSDVLVPVADDPSVIGSGPTVGDPTRFADALAIVRNVAAFPESARRVLERGAGGHLPETPKPGDRRLAKSVFRVIGNREDALRGAQAAAVALGYDVAVLPDLVCGEARSAAISYWDRATAAAQIRRRPACVLSAGETVVRVIGRGRGGRNQEFALALVEAISRSGEPVALASAGTDGIDGPTDAAGAIVSTRTLADARAAGLAPPRRFLDDNDAYAFFDSLGALVRTGPTETNIGDVQIALFG